jgi:threonine aldolase
MNDELATRRKELRARCRGIQWHGTPDAGAELTRVAAWCAEHEVQQDVYGEGELIEGFEAKVAALFGMEAGRFLPSGTMGQGIAMRVWCGPGGHFGMHPTSHLELHEERGYSHLFGLRATLVGPARRVMFADDLAKVSEPLGALLIELPTRENGGQLPTWEQLVELCGLAHERGIKVHLDGARIWEAQAAYERPFEELAPLFDSVYVSFYKGIGALSGAMLLGPRDFLGEAKLWQRRMGGNLYTLLPNVASAASRFDARLPRFKAYRERALTLAAALSAVPGVHLIPDPPHVNMMHVALDLSPADAVLARDRVAEATGLWLFGAARPLDLSGQSLFELHVGDAAMDVADEEIAAAFGALFGRN